jgi:hypothetical protein
MFVPADRFHERKETYALQPAYGKSNFPRADRGFSQVPVSVFRIVPLLMSSV